MSVGISLSQVWTYPKQNVRRQTLDDLHHLRIAHRPRAIDSQMNMLVHNFHNFDFYLMFFARFFNRNFAKDFQFVLSHHFEPILWRDLNMLPVRADRAPTMFVSFHFYLR